MAPSSTTTSGAPALQTTSNVAGQNTTLPSDNNGSSSGLSAGSQVGVAFGIVIIALLLGSIGLWATTQTRVKREAYGRLNGKEDTDRKAVEMRTW